MNTELTAVVYDRSLRELKTPDRISWMRARALQFAHRMLARVGYFGVSRAFGLINRLLPARTDMLVVEGEFRFRFPADDYYWNRLLDKEYQYEPEIHRFLEVLRDRGFLFVDLGANFRYWSTRSRRVFTAGASWWPLRPRRRALRGYGETSRPTGCRRPRSTTRWRTARETRCGSSVSATPASRSIRNGEERPPPSQTL